MKNTTDQSILAFALGELPLIQRLSMRVQLQFSRRDRLRLRELKHVSAAIAGALAPSGNTAFQANLAVKQRGFTLIDLGVSILFFSLATTAIVITAVNYVRNNCEVPVSTSRR